ncbi:MAG: response regulator transcription factor [Limnobacter sp.]|uniref:response regulator transcription factor n=1 Tax=unclassified Limnobacter TaxID=2630203 RepID=UPI000CF4FF0E|nr:response regulator transcription factor [Limnobacter sp. SAORIC-690]PQJ26011.1 DNA-binding response regulator [Limnobacter sp. SAORIC-690]
MLNTKVLIVDDHPAVRMALRMVLEREGFEVKEASDGSQAIQATREHEPNLVVLDIGLPKLDGLNVIQRLRALTPTLKIIVLTGQPTEIFAQRSLQAGASGFIHKQEDLCDLVTAARAVLSGHTYFPSVALPAGRPSQHGASDQEYLATLSDRELIVLKRLARGQRNQQIADELLLSSKTVSTYKTRLMQKINASSLVELTDFARRNGLA